MPHYQSKLTDRQEVAEGTMAFFFEKPSDFSFRAGQYLDLILIDPPETDSEGVKRDFTIASAPHETHLMVATRMRDTAFKRVLKKMSQGAVVTLEGPNGSFLLHNDSLRSAVFLAGGIGITPFRSMILDATERKLPHVIFLFYSNRRPEDAAFLKALQTLENQNKNFHLVATMTNMEKSSEPWQGERGYLRADLIKKYVSDLSRPIYYSAGPPEMVASMREMLEKAGVQSDNIKTEEFAGY